jgi:thiosulfate/3-mercaptopyruvate sulfurtransferase
VTFLISASTLRDESTAAPGRITVIDVRWRLGQHDSREHYDAGHLPGAAYLDIETEISGPPGALGRHPLPDLAVLEAALRRAGVSAHRPVVVYDHGDGMAAARAWWTLRWAGHTDVRVLDGGFPAWTGAGFPVSAAAEASEPGDFVVDPGHLRVLDAAAAATAPVLIDARAAVRYRGETEPIDPVAGHVPGAVNVPYADLVEADGRLRSADVLRSRFAETITTDPGTPIAAYCGSGITAAHTVLALAEAGYGDAGLYVGSWSEWITDPSRPIATGTEVAA